MFHFFDGAPQLPSLLHDQVQVGLALLSAHAATGETSWLERAKMLAEDPDYPSDKIIQTLADMLARHWYS